MKFIRKIRYRLWEMVQDFFFPLGLMAVLFFVVSMIFLLFISGGLLVILEFYSDVMKSGFWVTLKENVVAYLVLGFFCLIVIPLLYNYRGFLDDLKKLFK